MILEYYVSAFNEELRNEIDKRVSELKRVYSIVVVQCYCGSEQIAKSIIRYYKGKGISASGIKGRASLTFR